MTNVLFICRYNILRSKVAEGAFNKHNQNAAHEAKSAGIIGGGSTESDQALIAKKHDITIQGDSQQVTYDLLLWADVIVIVADNVPSDAITDNRPIIPWKDTPIVRFDIADQKGDESNREEVIENIIVSIEEKVKEFLKNL